MSLKRLSLSILAFVFLSVFVTSCKKNITDLLAAIDRYAYKASAPLGGKTVAIDNNLLGAYVFNSSVPVIISKKDAHTYYVKFLSIVLDKPDKQVEAHISYIDGKRFLNLSIGETDYAFLQLEELLNNQLKLKMLRNEIKKDVPEADLKKWLTKNWSKEYYVGADSFKVYLYYEFAFEKVPEQNAYDIQKSSLDAQKQKLFSACSSYAEYESLKTLYPNDPQLPLAVEALYTRCKTIEDYDAFINYFPGDPLAARAKERIEEIKIYTEDSLNYTKLTLYKGENLPLKEWEDFSNNCRTPRFRDLARTKLIDHANRITNDEIEWKWTSGDAEMAFLYLQYKIKYGTVTDLRWSTDRLILYSFKLKKKTEALACLDKLSERSPTKDDYLNLYMTRAFILWVNNETENALQIFQLKINEKFEGNGIVFKNEIFARQKSLKGQGVVFPSEKDTLKRIKKMQ